MMTPIARCNGTLLVESGRTSLRLVEQGGVSWMSTALFVTALVATILGANGLLNTALPASARGAMVAMAGLAGTAAAVLFRWRRDRRKRTTGGEAVVIFDFAGDRLIDGAGTAHAPLADARLTRTFQLASSSRALSLTHPTLGRIVLARGNPFGDSVDAIEQALVDRGITLG